MKASPAITTFNGGEFTPLLSGRTDLAKYANGARISQNMIPMIQGPSRRREGTRLVAETKSNGKAWLIRFVFNFQQSYVLEFGDLYIRFYKDRAQLLSGGLPYEIASPWPLSALTAADGSFAGRYVQSGDVIYMCVPGYQPRQINRFGATNWTITLYEPVGGPFKDSNVDQTVTVYASAATGTGITLTASSSIFQPGHVGSLFFLQRKDLSTIPPWEAGKSVTAGDLRRSDGKTYLSGTTATTGTDKPIHESGAASDGAVSWTYQDPGYGVVKITGYTSGTVVTADVMEPSYGTDRRLPAAVVGSGNATWRWAHGAWSTVEGWPAAVCFFRERLVFAKGQTFYFSVPNSYTDHAALAFGEVTADCAIVATATSDRSDNVVWMVPLDRLVVGTTASEMTIGELTTNEPFGPSNIKITQQTTFGSCSVPPVRVNASTLFWERTQLQLMEFIYDFASDSFKSSDLTPLAEHITNPKIIDMAYAQQPDRVVWAVRGDGLLVGFTFNRDQDVLGWHRHPIGGYADPSRRQGAVVEAVQAIPAPDGSTDDLWLIVRRSINGVTKRYVEYLTPRVRIPDRQPGESAADYAATRRYWQALYFNVDSGLSLDNPIAITAITTGATVTVTAAGHGLVTGDGVRIDGVLGTTDVNGRAYTVTVTGPNTFTLNSTDGTAFGLYVGSGFVRKQVTTISGLGHLEGETVDVIVDGAAHPQRVVSGGAITLQAPAAIVHVGLPYRSVLAPMRIEAGGNAGTAQSKTKRIHKLAVRVVDTLGGKSGPNDDALDPFEYRTGEDDQPMGFPPPLKTGDVSILFDGRHDPDGFIQLVQDQPLPFCVAALYPELSTNE